MTHRTVLLLMATCGIAACSTVPAKPPIAWAMKAANHADAESRDKLIGRWYEETVESDGTKMAELKDLRRDGTYQMTFR